MFSRSAFFVKSVPEWRALAKRNSVEAAARSFARENMVAVVHHGDDSATAYLYDVANNRVARAKYRTVTWGP